VEQNLRANAELQRLEKKSQCRASAAGKISGTGARIRAIAAGYPQKAKKA